MKFSTTTLEKRTSIIAVLLILAVSGLGGAYFYFKTLQERNTEKFNSAYGEARLLHMRGEYDMAVEKFKQALSLAPNEMAAAEGKRLLAHALLRVGGGTEEDRAQAIQLYKEVIADPATPVKWRALALSDMAFAFDLTGDKAFIDRAVFNEEPYAAYRRESGTDIYGALRRIYEQSDALYPTAFAKLQIAAKYAIPLPNGQTERQLTSSQTAGLIKQYVDNAVPLVQSLPYEESVVAYMHLLSATSLKAIEPILEDVTIRDVETAYQEAIVAAGASNDAAFQNTLMLSRLFYAMTLADKFGKSRTEDISNLVSSLLREEASSRRLTAYLRYFAAFPLDDFRKRELLKISEISPEFRALLSEVGWSI